MNINKVSKLKPSYDEVEKDLFTIIDATGQETKIEIPIEDIKKMTLGDYLFQQRNKIDNNKDMFDLDDLLDFEFDVKKEPIV